MGLFKRSISTSTYDRRDMCENSSTQQATPNPDPTNFQIIRSVQFTDWLVVEILFPDCTNYEGRKILMYEDTSIEELIEQKVVDPHFCDNQQFNSPVARFEPTNVGWAMACYTAARFTLLGDNFKGYANETERQ